MSGDPERTGPQVINDFLRPTLIFRHAMQASVTMYPFTTIHCGGANRIGIYTMVSLVYLHNVVRMNTETNWSIAEMRTWDSGWSTKCVKKINEKNLIYERRVHYKYFVVLVNEDRAKKYNKMGTDELLP